jgi:hypothetical protein
MEGVQAEEWKEKQSQNDDPCESELVPNEIAKEVHKQELGVEPDGIDIGVVHHDAQAYWFARQGADIVLLFPGNDLLDGVTDDLSRV